MIRAMALTHPRGMLCEDGGRRHPYGPQTQGMARVSASMQAIAAGSDSAIAQAGVRAFIAALNRGPRSTRARVGEPLAPAYGPLSKGQAELAARLNIDDPQAMALTAALEEMLHE